MFVRVKEHADLRREGLTVHSDVSVSYVDAILGMHMHSERYVTYICYCASTGWTFPACCPFCLCMPHFAPEMSAVEQHVQRQDKAVLQMSQCWLFGLCALD